MTLPDPVGLDHAAEAIQAIPFKLDEVVNGLATIAAMMSPTLSHIPTLAPRIDGTWGVFCWKCSAEQNTYVNPCDVSAGPDTREWPPEVMTAAESTRDGRLEAVRNHCANVVLSEVGNPALEAFARQLITLLNG
jgi:hypothetical protein